MSTNLGKIIEEVGSSVGIVVLRSVATGGSTTSLIDTSLANGPADGKFNGYLMVISSTTDGLAPQSQFAVITGYVSSTQTFSFAAMTAAPGAGDKYTILNKRIALYDMIDRINRGVEELDLLLKYDTSLTTTDNTLAYTLPSSVKGFNLQRVQCGSDSTGWMDVVDYDLVPAPGGSLSQLIFHRPLQSSQTIKVWYLQNNTPLSVYSDTVDDRYMDIYVESTCAVKVQEFLMDKKVSSWSDKNQMTHLNDLRQRSMKAAAQNPVRNPPFERARSVPLRDA